ncbi:MAG: hypothetical protein K8W52_07640 [Deltaproteobacteria bacterium]|nr:hypothetical protein [Deltaproteobacteria bacterium]
MDGATPDAAADALVFEAVIRESRELRRVHVPVALAAFLVAIVTIPLALHHLLGPLAAVAALVAIPVAILRLVRPVRALPAGPLSIFDGSFALERVTFARTPVTYVSDGRYPYRLVGPTARSLAFCEAVRRRFPAARLEVSPRARLTSLPKARLLR